MWKICFFSCLYFYSLEGAAQNLVRYLPIFQAECGIKYSYAFSNNWAVKINPDKSVSYFREERNNFGVSTFGRVMASTALNFFQFRENKNFRWGDVFIVETRLGFRREQIEQSNHLLLGYQFSVGLVANYLINSEHEIGLMLVPLKFTSDKVSPNISGSYIAFRYGSKKFAITFQYESRDLSFGGWLVAATLNPRQYSIEMLIRKKYGLRAEWASNRYYDKIYGGQYHNSFPSASIFYIKTF
ncbi:MAG: hypothetical protein ACK40K_00675 [Raineya sp.]